MGMTELSLRHRGPLALAGGLLVVAGAWVATRLPLDAFPDVSPNLVQVFTVTEGLGPEEVERYVTYPVESTMAGLPGLERLRSVSNFGLSVVNLYFEDTTDPYLARQLVSERLIEAKEQIPEGFGEPEMGPMSTGMGLISFYYLRDTTGRYGLEELRTIQDWVVKYRLQTVPGVTEVLGIGGYERQYHVVLEPEALLRYDLPVERVVERIEANNSNVGAQFLVQGREELVVRSTGLVQGVGDLERVVVETVDGTPVLLSQVAQVEVGGAVRRGLQTRNGRGEVVAGMVIKLFGANSSQVIERVEERLEEIQEILPEGVEIVPYYQQKDLVEAAVGTVTGALLQGIGLVALVLLLFMGSVRASLVVAASIPFSVLFAVLAMAALDISANLMSLGGLAIAIGMMVDGAIVLVERVDVGLKEAGSGVPRIAVVGASVRELVRPVTFSVAVVVVVFLPLFTLQGVEGKTFRPLAYTTALGLVGSLVFAVALVPGLASWAMVSTGSGTGPGILGPLRSIHAPLVARLVARPWVAVVLALSAMAGAAGLLPTLGSEFTPRLEEGTLVVRLTMAPSISLEESKRTALLVERRLMGIPAVAEVVTRVGRGEVGAHTDPVNSAEIYVLLREEARGDQEAVEREIREVLDGVPGVVVALTQPIEMTVDELLEGVRAELAVKLFGDDLRVLEAKAEEVAGVVARIPGAADVQVDQVAGTPQVVVTPDRSKLARYGLDVADLQAVIGTAVGGKVAGQVFEGVRRFDILVRFAPEARDSPEAIGRIMLHTPSGALVPLGEVATVRTVVGPRQITREDNQRFVAIQANVVGRDIGSFVEEAERAIRDRVSLPPGYEVGWGGQFRLQQEANRRLGLVVPVTLLFIGALLFMAFGAWRPVLLVLLDIPLALVGGVVALWVSGQHLSVPSSVGFIALFGVALGNGMVLVTELERLVARGAHPGEAAILASTSRLRPVLMTAITTGLGLAPLLVATGTGSDVQRPLATVVTGGLVTSTLVTLFVLPAVYPWFARAPWNGGSGGRTANERVDLPGRDLVG